MFLIDDLLILPFRSTMWLADKVAEAAAQELEAAENAIVQELGQLYQMLETNAISEAAFDKREGELLERLDEIQLMTGRGEADA